MLRFDLERTMKFKDFKEMAAQKENGLNHDQIEELFWAKELPKQISKKSFPTYAIDNEMCRCPDSHEYWNLNKLTTNESILQVSRIPGVTTPFTNFGMNFTSFGAHIEDSNMGSINTHLEGAPRPITKVQKFNVRNLPSITVN